MELNNKVIMEQNCDKNSLISLLLKFEDMNQRIISEYDNMDNKMMLSHRLDKITDRLHILIKIIDNAKIRLNDDYDKVTLDCIKTLSEGK